MTFNLCKPFAIAIQANAEGLFFSLIAYMNMIFLEYLQLILRSLWVKVVKK